MSPGALTEKWSDRPTPLEKFIAIADAALGGSPAPMALKLFGTAGRAYSQRFGFDSDMFAEITVKGRKHAAANTRAVFRERVTLEQVLESPNVCEALTRLQCCPPTCGAAAALS